MMVMAVVKMMVTVVTVARDDLQKSLDPVQTRLVVVLLTLSTTMVDWVWLAARLPPGVDDRRGPCSQAATALAALALAATPASVLHRCYVFWRCGWGGAGLK